MTAMDAAQADQREEMAQRDTEWVCPYCGNHVGHEPTRPCCGEMGHEIEVYADTGESVDE